MSKKEQTLTNRLPSGTVVCRQASSVSTSTCLEATDANDAKAKKTSSIASVQVYPDHTTPFRLIHPNTPINTTPDVMNVPKHPLAITNVAQTQSVLELVTSPIVQRKLL